MADKYPEFEPPVTCVSRVIKQSLTQNMILTKDAKAAFVRAAGIFIFYLTHYSNENAKEEKRKTIKEQDVVKALNELGFEDFEDTVSDFLEAFKSAEEETKAGRRANIIGDGADGDDGDDRDDNDAAPDDGADDDNDLGDSSTSNNRNGGVGEEEEEEEEEEDDEEEDEEEEELPETAPHIFSGDENGAIEEEDA